VLDEVTVQFNLHQRCRSTLPRSPSPYPHSDPRVLPTHTHPAHTSLTPRSHPDPHAHTLTLTFSVPSHPAAPATRATSSSPKPHRSDSQCTARPHRETLKHPSGWPPPFEPSEPTAPPCYRFRWSVEGVLQNFQRVHKGFRSFSDLILAQCCRISWLIVEAWLNAGAWLKVKKLAPISRFETTETLTLLILHSIEFYLIGPLLHPFVITQTLTAPFY
jgi:hypothetical protein